ncbi:hypothetical protein ACFOW1_01100 [Parasediminibacterium paludis]|uniref:Ig-like domain-containing protein n=1 Tax=Parasediminibacterium paludis TaxID=908966 RepID=A0ABV8PTJ3_9BACT
MKPFLKYIVVSLTVVIAFCACNKAISDEFVSYANNPLNDTTWSNVAYTSTVLNKIIFPEITKGTTVIDSFDCLGDSKLIFGDSLQILVPANSCMTINGSPITNNGSKITAEISWLKNKGDFIKYAMPTTNVFSLLEASNYCDIRLTKDGQEVAIVPNAQVKIRCKDTTANSNMKFFVGNAIQYARDSVFAWSPSSDGKIALLQDNSTGKIWGYEFTTSRIRWFGAANYADSSVPKTKLNIILPPNFTNKNTVVYAVLKNTQTIISLLSNPDNRTFFTLNIPVNTEFTLVAVSKINDDYYFDSRIIKNASANPIGLLPYKKPLPDILEIINKL